MAAADGWRRTLNGARAIAGRLGLRPYRVFVVETQHDDSDSYVDDEIEVVHADSRPPKVRYLDANERYAAGLQQLSVEVGPVTPAFAGGGFTEEQLNPALCRQTSFHYRLEGPGMGDAGRRFALREMTRDSALHYMLTLELSETGQTLR